MRNVKVISFNSKMVEAAMTRLQPNVVQTVQFDQLGPRFMGSYGRLVVVASVDNVVEHMGLFINDTHKDHVRGLGWTIPGDEIAPTPEPALEPAPEPEPELVPEPEPEPELVPETEPETIVEMPISESDLFDDEPEPKEEAKPVEDKPAKQKAAKKKKVAKKKGGRKKKSS